MGLRDLKFPTAQVEVPGCGSFAVRGLSTIELEGLLQNHGGEMREAYETIKSGVENESLPGVIGQMARSMPRLVGSIIAVASDDPDGVEYAVRLPIASQLKALDVIGGLTFGIEGGLKKSVADAVQKLGGWDQLIKSVQQVR